MRQLAELQVLFPEYKHLAFADLLRGISKDTLMRVATFLIGQDLYSNKEMDNHYVIEHWFSDGNKTFAQELMDRIDAYEVCHQKSLKIVSVISALQILQTSLEFDDAQLLNTKSKEHSEIDLLFGMLVANQNMDYNQRKDLKTAKAMFPDLAPAAVLLNYSFPTHDITNFHFQDYGYCQIIKALLLFVYLESTPEGIDLLARMNAYFGIGSWKEYFERIVPIVTAWANSDKASSVDLVLNNDAQYNEHLNFLKKLAMDGYVKMEDIDYKLLRERPLLELDPHTFRIIHPLFVLDKVYKGLYFLLNALNASEPKAVKSNFRSWYTTSFSEAECFAQLIEYSFPNPDEKAYDAELRTKGVIGPPDCYIRSGDNVFLFENKDILINAKIKGGYGFEELINELKKKLLVEDNGRPVGIGQIINNLRKLLTGKYIYDSGFSRQQSIIYPTIVTHDPMFDTPGLNKILQGLFNDKLAKLQHEGIDISRVRPLVIMNIDCLILAGHLLRNGSIQLNDLLEAYYENCRCPKKTHYAPGELDEECRNSCLSFYNFQPHYLSSKFPGGWRSQEMLEFLFQNPVVSGVASNAPSGN